MPDWMRWRSGHRGRCGPRGGLGTVTLDGKPLSGAVIQFVPSDPNAPGGTSADIEDGKFAIESGRGPVAGNYRVVISTRMGAEVDATQPPGEAPKPKKDPIPAKYNTKSELKAEVKAGARTRSTSPPRSDGPDPRARVPWLKGPGVPSTAVPDRHDFMEFIK